MQLHDCHHASTPGLSASVSQSYNTNTYNFVTLGIYSLGSAASSGFPPLPDGLRVVQIPSILPVLFHGMKRQWNVVAPESAKLLLAGETPGRWARGCPLFA